MVDCSNRVSYLFACCNTLVPVFAAFLLFASPWLALGPWVTYTLNADLMDTTSETNTTFDDFYLQYPILQFDRQQYLSKLCFTNINTDLWLAVFRKDPQQVCSRRSGRCRLVYCLYDWDVMVNNRTTFVTNVKLFANPSYYLTVTDACWFVWWLPAGAMLFFDCPLAIPLVYTIVVFAMRVSLSVASMVKFFDYNAMTDPPYTGYLKTNQDVQDYTSWKYDWGFAFGWIELISNGITFLLLVAAGIVYGCSLERKENLNRRVHGWRSNSRRVRSRLTNRFSKNGGRGEASDAKSAKSAADPTPDAV